MLVSGLVHLADFIFKVQKLDNVCEFLQLTMHDANPFNKRRDKLVSLNVENMFEKVNGQLHFCTARIEKNFRNLTKFKTSKFYFTFNIFFLTNSLFLNKQLNLNNGYFLLNAKLFKNNVVVLNCLKSIQR